MKNTIVLAALSALFFISCAQQNDDQVANTITTDRPAQEALQTFTAEQLDQLRAIMKDEAAKAVGAVHLDLIASGKISIPNTDPTFVNGVPVAEIDDENTRYYLGQLTDNYEILCKNWGVCWRNKDGSRGNAAPPKLRYKGYDYLMSFFPSHYVLELECMTQSFYVSVLDSETGEQLEDLWFTVDEKQKLTQPNPADPLYKGRVIYTRFNQKNQTGTTIPDYGISIFRLGQLLKLAPEVLKHGEVVKV